MSTAPCYQKYFLIGFGTSLLIGGTLLSGFWPAITRAVLKPQLVLSNHSQSFDMWKETPLPIYMDFYFFHWANPERTLDGTETPKFVEKGPYVFREYHTKANISWNDNNTVTFMQIRKWIFMQNLTKPGLSLDDKINSVNPIAYTVSALLKRKNFTMVERLAIDSVLRIWKTKMYITKPIRQLLFEGYEDPLLSALQSIKKILPIPISTNKFGWFYQHNMSSEFDGVLNMGTGADSLKNLGIMQNWDYKSDTGFFKGECGKIGGTTGEVWPPDSAKGDHVTLFAPDLCSSLNLHRGNSTEVQGLQGTVFEGQENVFDNGTKYPENKCYLNNVTTSVRTGVRCMSSCRFGAPIYISFPHFYLADPTYAGAISGMNSSGSHQFQMILEENTGIPLKVNARLQINIKSSPTPGYGIFDHLPDVFLPVLWFDQHMYITPELAKSIWIISVVPGYITYGLITVAVLGAILLFWGVLLARRDCRRTADMQELLKDTDDQPISAPPPSDPSPVIDPPSTKYVRMFKTALIELGATNSTSPAYNRGQKEWQTSPRSRPPAILI